MYGCCTLLWQAWCFPAGDYRHKACNDAVGSGIGGCRLFLTHRHCRIHSCNLPAWCFHAIDYRHKACNDGGGLGGVRLTFLTHRHCTPPSVQSVGMVLPRKRLPARGRVMTQGVLGWQLPTSISQQLPQPFHMVGTVRVEV